MKRQPMNKRFALGLAALLIAATGAACSSNDSSSSDGEPSAETSAAGSDTTDADGGTPATPAPPASPAPSDSSLGSCEVNVTGDVETSWTSPGGPSSVGYGPWVDATAGTVLGVPLDSTYFIVNCVGPGLSSISFVAAVNAEIQQQPATYVIPTATNAFGGSSTPSEIQMILSLDGTDTNWGPSADGTFTITRFDDDGIAGTFNVAVTDVLASIPGGGPSKGDAVVSGSFEYVNLN